MLWVSGREGHLRVHGYDLRSEVMSPDTHKCQRLRKAAYERRENTLDPFNDFGLKVTARIWPSLSYASSLLDSGSKMVCFYVLEATGVPR